MELLSKDVILQFSPNTLESVRKNHGFDKSGDMEIAIDIFDAWIKQQNHFTKKDFDRDYLERMIIANKGSVEKAKGRLDKLCTLRTLMPQYFGDYDVKNDFKNLQDNFAYVPLPKMGNNFQRIFFMQNSGKKFNDDIFMNAYRNIAMLVEYFKIHDYADSYIFLIDMRETNMTDLVMKLGLVEVRQIMALITDGYGLRLKGMHFLTNSKLIDTLVTMLKQVLSTKLAERIKVHTKIESLYELVPREILPKEYGGDELYLKELREKWNDVLSSEAYRSKWREMISARTNETLRPKDTFNDQYLGMPGTFRVLTVD
ncbi:hypothetical protein O0L34_g1962 [Tuta absoluta]|nr:hypothetical protein O0L34_g1962 [Tuta absoluta]